MIQRIQSIYLFLVELIYLSLFFIPVYNQHFDKTNIVNGMTLLDMPVLIGITIVISFFAVYTIIQFKKRPLQIKFCNIGMLLSATAFAAVTTFPNFFTGEVTETQIHFHTSFGIGTWFFALPIFLFFLASRAIKKDEELVRSADRIR